MTNNRYDNSTAYVANDAQPAAPRLDLIRREDVVDKFNRLMDLYGTQQNEALTRVQGDVTSSGYLSNADQVRERRHLTRMYLMVYFGVSALLMAGLATLAYIGGASTILTIAAWMSGTGVLTAFLVWRRHGDEFHHSPEGIANNVIDSQFEIAMYHAETQRLAIKWEHQTEQKRLAAQQAAIDAQRQQAAARITELETRRRTIEAQQQAHAQWYAPAPVEIAPVEVEQEAEPVAPVDGDVLTALSAWLIDAYANRINNDGVIVRGRVPWAQRSDWTEADKAEARRLCVEIRPPLIVATKGNQWRIRIEMFPDAELAMRLLYAKVAD